MNLNAYPKNQYRIVNPLELRFFIRAFRGDYANSHVSALSLFDFYHITHWTPNDVHISDLRILCKQMRGFDTMSNKKQFVMNNLTSDELTLLDTTYPEADAIDAQASKLIQDYSVTFALQLDKEGNYICYGNQGNYAVSGRSSTALDAFVIVLFKFGLCNNDLSSVAVESVKKFTRG